LVGEVPADTPGVQIGVNGTVRLDDENEPQPDAQLRVVSPEFGQSRVNADGYIEGAAELIVEVASSSVSFDLGDKLEAYRRNGVREYLVWRVLEQKIDWFILRDGQFQRLQATRRPTTAFCEVRPFQVYGCIPRPSWAGISHECSKSSRMAWRRSNTRRSWIGYVRQGLNRLAKSGDGMPVRGTKEFSFS
jgi:hypothetical protein